MRRTPLRSKPQPDPVTSEVRNAVMVRDRECVLAKLEPGHVCSDVWGYRHPAGDLARLTLEHVKDRLAMGKRAPSDPAHLVLLCYAANLRVPTKAQRAMFRDYLATVSDPEHAHVELMHGCPECDVIRQAVVA